MPRQGKAPPRPLDRGQLVFRPLRDRANRKQAPRDTVSPDAPAPVLDGAAAERIAEAASRIRAARRAGAPVILAFGAHTIKNGLGRVLAALLRDGWITHLATNGAGIIHDWEFAFQGATSEDVEAGVARGEFGLWQETGHFINLALNVGAYEGKGYGESVGAFIAGEGLAIPEAAALEAEVRERVGRDPAGAAAAADLLAVVRAHSLPAGRLEVPHPGKAHSAQAAAWSAGVPFTGHPMFGHDIIYLHPMNHGASLGRAAERDFLAFAGAVSRIEGGVYLSVGSAVMSPMIFEKAMAMAQNLARQRGAPITRHYILAVDLAPCAWDWSRGEPPEDRPEYYLRFHKTFRRMGGTVRYLSLDNRAFLLALRHALS